MNPTAVVYVLYAVAALDGGAPELLQEQFAAFAPAAWHDVRVSIDLNAGTLAMDLGPTKGIARSFATKVASTAPGVLMIGLGNVNGSVAAFVDDIACD